MSRIESCAEWPSSGLRPPSPVLRSDSGAGWEKVPDRADEGLLTTAAIQNQSALSASKLLDFNKRCPRLMHDDINQVTRHKAVAIARQKFQVLAGLSGPPGTQA